MHPPPTRIGLVFSYSLDFCRGVLRGIKAFAEARPHWILMPVAPEPRAIETLRQLRPSGLIGHVFEQALADKLATFRRPLVNVSSVLPDLPFPRVGSDDHSIGQLGAAHLLDRGFRHFGFVGHPHHAYSVRREAGFRQTIEPTGYTLDYYYDHDERPFDPMGRLWALDKALQRWVRSLPKPAGIFAPNDLWGVQLTEVCRQAELRVPEDVAIVGVDNDDLLCELARPSLSSVALPVERIGYEAAALLERLLAKEAPPRQPLLLPPLGVAIRQSSNVLALSDPDVVAALRFIREHAHTPLRVKDVLREVPVSRRSLERRFRKILNRGLWEEIRRAHMERAKHLLAATEFSMAEVAKQAGFSGAEQLSVVFRQELGLPPSAYRRQISKTAGTMK
jgi:LacI family transcriptional regulator